MSIYACAADNFRANIFAPDAYAQDFSSTPLSLSRFPPLRVA